MLESIKNRAQAGSHVAMFRRVPKQILICILAGGCVSAGAVGAVFGPVPGLLAGLVSAASLFVSVSSDSFGWMVRGVRHFRERTVGWSFQKWRDITLNSAPGEYVTVFKVKLSEEVYRELEAGRLPGAITWATQEWMEWVPKGDAGMIMRPTWEKFGLEQTTQHLPRLLEVTLFVDVRRFKGDFGSLRVQVEEQQ